MADALTNFKISLDKFPKSSNDINIICSITYAEYVMYVKILSALLYPQRLIRSELELLTTTIDNATYNTIITAITRLNAAYKSILPEPFYKNMGMTLDIARVGDLLSNVCADFLGSLPENLFNIFQDMHYGLIDLSKVTNGILALPSDLTGSIVGNLLKLKDDAMKEMLGASFDTVLSPLIEYDNFLQENGVQDIIKKMKKTESCMTKKGLCARPRSEFIEPSTKKLYSQYFQSQFLLNSKGQVNIRSFGGTSQQQSQINNIIRNMNSFRLIVR